MTSGVLQEPTLSVTQQMLAAAQLHGKYVVDEYRALQKRAHIEQEESNDKINKLQKAREELQKAVEELQKAVEEQGEVRCQVILASPGLPSFVCCTLLLCLCLAVQ